MFSSDNGPHDEAGRDPTFFKASAPFKGIKRDVYDGGIHVPKIVHWLLAITKPRVDDTPWAFADVLPTFADLAGVSLNSVPRVKTNGVSIGPLLRDDPGTLPQRTLYWEFGKQAGDPNSGIVGEVFQAARHGKWKAVRYGMESPVEIYNLADADYDRRHQASGFERGIFLRATDRPGFLLARFEAGIVNQSVMPCIGDFDCDAVAASPHIL